jgi:3-hydroxybutyrate dehydrogenase/3-oxoacyl-[acyl-carrier protein] reductase
MQQLNDKVAVVTGGTAGIGKGIATAFVAEGASVVVNGRNAEAGEKTLAELDAGDRATFIAGDVKRLDDVEALIAGAIDRYGRVDVLVNNAGGANGLGPAIWELPDEVWHDTIAWNLTSTFWATRAVLRHMVPRKSGRIINISSIEGKHGKAVLSPYVAAKHGINGFTKSVAQEVGTLGITVNSICPGLVITDVIMRSGPKTAEGMGLTLEGLIDLFAAESAIKRPNTVEEVAAVATLLASDAAAGITGAVYSVDGGTAAY